MKIQILTLFATLLLIPATVSAQNLSQKTYFEGERITGVSASSGFEVVLVKSEHPKAVVEVSDMIESYIRISRDGAGLVSVGRKELNSREQKEYNRLRENQNLTMRLTLHLPSINTVRLSSSAVLSSADSFSGESFDILASSSGAIRGEFRISSERVKVQAGSSAKIENLILGATGNLVVVASSSARVAIHAPRLAYSKLGVSSSATVQLSGAGEQGEWNASSSARIDAGNFTAKDLSVNSSSSARVTADVSAGGADINISATSSANVVLAARGVGLSRISVTSGASVRITGNGEQGDWSTTSNGKIVAEEFALKNLDVDASSGSSVRANVSGTLTTRTSSSGSVRYTGNPARINDQSSGVRPL